MGSWEEEERDRGYTRREWVRFSMALGTVGALGGLGGLVTGQLLPPPVQFGGTVSETLRYVKFPTPQWWNTLDGENVKPSDFANVWDGATAVWRGVYQNGQWFPGTGFPVLVIRIPYASQYFTAPSTSDLQAQGVASPPTGFDLFYKDDTNKVQIVVLFDRCVHLCCYPGWHVVSNPPPDYLNYVVPSPTHQDYGQDPVYCICHGSQYDPLLLAINYNPVNNVNYVGATRVHGPAPRALALIPVQLKGGALVGGMPDPRWYEYC